MLGSLWTPSVFGCGFPLLRNLPTAVSLLSSGVLTRGKDSLPT